MKKLFVLLLLISSPVLAGQSSLTVSSGTFLAIDGYIAGSGNFRQAIALGSSSFTYTAPVDAVQGLTVTVSSGIAEIGNVKNSGTFAVQAAQNGTWNVGTVTAVTAISNALPAGTNNIGTVTGSTVTIMAPAGNTSNIPVSASQTGTWTVQPGNTANTTAWKVDGSAVTQPVSGTVTANAGTGSFNVNQSTLAVMNVSGGNLAVSQSGTWTVQPGNTPNTTAWKVDGSAVTQPVSGTFWQATQPISGTVTAAQTVNSSLRASVDIDGSSNTVVLGGGSATIGALTANQSVNVAQINGVTPLMGNGTAGTGSHRATISSDNSAIANWGHGATGASVPSGSTYVSGIAKTALPTAATDGNLTGQLMDKFGRDVISIECPRDLRISASVTLNASTTETVFLSSGAASVFNDMLMALVVNTSGTAARIDFRSGGGPTGGAVDFPIYVPAGDTRGYTVGIPWPQSASASNWTVQSSASVADIRIAGLFCKNK